MGEEYGSFTDNNGNTHVYTGSVSDKLFPGKSLVIVDTVLRDGEVIKQYFAALPMSVIEDIHSKMKSLDE